MTEITARYPRSSLETSPGSRTAVVGGGGKTTLARALAEKYGVTHVELDAIYWKPAWREREAREFIEKTAVALKQAPQGWVADGNYFTKLGGFVVSQADTVIWVNMPWRVMFWRTLWRSVARARDGRLICGENRESWRLTFFSRDSLLWFHIKTRKAYRKRGEVFIPYLSPGTRLIEIRSPRELRRYYKIHGLVKA